MAERIQRTQEGLSLVDPTADTGFILKWFPQIIVSYNQLSPDFNKNATALINRQRALSEKTLEGVFPNTVEDFILRNSTAAEVSTDAHRYSEAIGIYRQALNQVDFLVQEEMDQRFARMWFFDQTSYNFYQIGMQGKGDDKACVQSVIACIYSDLELGAKHTTISRGRNALSTVYGARSFDETRTLMCSILIGKEKELPRDWWNPQREQELNQLLTKH